jgi:lysophospholipase L1-like esterase
MPARRFPALAHGLAIILFFLGGIAYPLWKNYATATFVVGLLLIYGSIWLGETAWLERLTSILRRPWAQKAALVLASTAVTLGGIEYLAQFLVRGHFVEIYSPMLTQLPSGTEDWRVAHITADEVREPDPVLWWRPMARPPYNDQRMKGPEVAEDKPARTFRILCYGDSNTDGPDRGGWPERLQAVLEREAPTGMTYEVLNAGVSGYSSHQGLLRFRQQVGTFRPDLVLVSFGWNDLATALGAPDNSFRPPGSFRVSIERLLLHYRFYLILKRYLPRNSASSAEAIVGHRVPIEDYLDNMEGFLEAAGEHGARVVYLTRPHRESTERMKQINDNWRGEVPQYNEALVRFGRDEGALVVDVQGVFEERFPGAFVDECHFTPEGHQAMAELLYARLFAAGYLTASSSRVRETSRDGRHP